MSKSKHAWYAAFIFLPLLAFTQQAAPPAAPAAQSPGPAGQPAAPGAQTPALNPRPSYTPEPAPAEARMHLDVVVTDKSGKPVPGLELQDFKLKDSNLPTKILSFQAIPGSPSAPPTEVTLVLDGVNLGFQTVARTRDEISKFLRENSGHLAQPVSVIMFTDKGAKVLLQPSTDGNALAAQLDRADSELRVISRSEGTYGDIERYQLSLQWAALIARSEAKRPGRKVLIWAGPGWPLLDRPGLQTSSKGEQQIFNEIVDLSTTLREGRITLYSVSLGDTNAGTFLYQDFLKGVKTADRANPSDLALKVIATQSGGRVLGPDNDIAAQVEKCIEDSRSFYTLSFDPPKADKPNEYHDLKIEIGKPGLTARTNTGYYNQP
jgi:VWFA-related protein